MNALGGVGVSVGRAAGGTAAPDFVTNFLSVLADRVVLLDVAGRVTCLSEAPPLVTQGVAAPTLLRPGVSYLALCRRAEAAGLAAAGRVADGVTAVLRGTRPDVRIELAGEPALELQATPLQTGLGAAVIHCNVTAAAARLAELHRLAYSDSLTGLNNRRYFLQEADNYLRGVRRDDRGAVLVFLDLDGFKEVNDGHGHATGDALLKIMGARLRGLLRSGDLLARLGGDEFAFLVQVSGEREVEALLERIRHTLRQPVMLDGAELRLEVSVGAALASTADDLTGLLEQADRAMYAAKRRRGSARFRDEAD